MVYPRFQFALIDGQITERIIRDPKDENPEVWKETPADLKNGEEPKKTMKPPAKKRPPGRPKGSAGVRMPCGWGCGGEFTQAEMREHWKACTKRPARRRAAN